MSDVYDIAVIGAGPAGAQAALAAGGESLRVVLLDEQPCAGGQVWRSKAASVLSAPLTPETAAGDALRKALGESDVTCLFDTRVWQIARDSEGWSMQTLHAAQSGEVRARRLILASGAREFVQPVPGWTTPGVIGLAGATALFKQNLTPPAGRTVVSGTGPLVFFVASEVRRLGGTVAAVVTPSTRAEWMRALPQMLGKPGLLARGAVWMADLMLARVPVLWGQTVTQVIGTDRVSAVEVAPLQASEMSTRIEAESLCLGHGLIPQIEAAQLLGVGIRHDPAIGGWVPEMQDDGSTAIEGLYLCGDGTGIRGADAAVHHGRLCGLRAARDAGVAAEAEMVKARAAWRKSARFGLAMTALSIPKSALTKLSTDQTIICRCESLTRQAILAEVSSGATSTNAVKSGVRAGMGPCGGKYCQTAIARLIASETGGREGDVPPPTARPPLRPVPVAAAAGDFDYDDLPIPKLAPL